MQCKFCNYMLFLYILYVTTYCTYGLEMACISICIKDVISAPHLPFLSLCYVQGKSQDINDVHYESWLNARKWCNLPVFLEAGVYCLFGKWSNGETLVQSQTYKL